MVRALLLGHRQVVTLLLEGLSQREIAEVLGTTENAVNVRASFSPHTRRASPRGESPRAGKALGSNAWSVDEIFGRGAVGRER